MRKFKKFIEKNPQVLNLPHGVFLPKKVDLKFEDTYDFIDQRKVFNEQRCLQFIYGNGKKIYESEFEFSVYEQEVFLELLFYAIGTPSCLEKTDLQVQKGLMLMGPEGSGKTAYLKLIRGFFPGNRQYKIYNVNQLVADYSLRGYAAIDELFQENAKIICLSGVGYERIGMNYGSSCDVVYEIVQRLYNNRNEDNQPILHLTTRHNVKGLVDRYGERFRTMLKVLVNQMVVS